MRIECSMMEQQRLYFQAMSNVMSVAMAGIFVLFCSSFSVQLSTGLCVFNHLFTDTISSMLLDYFHLKRLVCFWYHLLFCLFFFKKNSVSINHSKIFQVWYSDVTDSECDHWTRIDFARTTSRNIEDRFKRSITSCISYCLFDV